MLDVDTKFDTKCDCIKKFGMYQKIWNVSKYFGMYQNIWNVSKMILTKKDFRSRIGKASTRSSQLDSFDPLIGESKVNQLNNWILWPGRKGYGRGLSINDWLSENE